jgi:hypothetical protein
MSLYIQLLEVKSLICVDILKVTIPHNEQHLLETFFIGVYNIFIQYSFLVLHSMIQILNLP